MYIRCLETGIFKTFNLELSVIGENKSIYISFVISFGGYKNQTDIKVAKPFTCR